jgi:hypothetical protein
MRQVPSYFGVPFDLVNGIIAVEHCDSKAVENAKTPLRERFTRTPYKCE